MRKVLQAEKTVIHAGGIIDGHSYTNSQEALNNCYDRGNRISEFDFLFTSDDKLVCAHDDSRWAYGIDSNTQLSESDFLEKKFQDIYTTMSADNLANFMRSHKDFYVVTDIKDNNIEGCCFLANNYPDLIDNFIIQIYHIDEYDPICQLGFSNIIFTLYMTMGDENKSEVLVHNIADYDLLGMTFWESWMDNEEFFDNIKNTGILMLVHTVNDSTNIENDLASGVLIYTDNVNNDWIRNK